MATGGSPRQTTDSNAVLKLKFKKLHKTVIDNVNPASIIHFLFQEDVIGDDDMRALQKIKDDPQQQCGDLMALLHTSQHPQAFIQLYAAVKTQSHLKWLVERIDNFSDQSVMDLLQQLDISKPTGITAVKTTTASRVITAAVRSTTPTPTHIKAVMKSTTPTLTHVIPSQGGDSVSAVTSLGNDVFVARHKSQQVEVYDAVTLTLQRRLTVPGLGAWTSGLAACPNNNCLYACDNGDNSVHRVKLSRRNVVKTWSVASSPAGLSVNSKHNLIVAYYDANKLQEYTTHGSIVREICLQAGVTQPWHAIQLSTGTTCYVVSQYTSPGVVSVVGVDGKVVRSYGQSKTSDVGQMGNPSNLTVVAETKNDDILVADEGNNRILSIDSSVGSIQQSKTSDVGQMMNPSSLAVTKNDDILVADEGNNRILLINSSLGSIQELALSVDGGIHWPEGLCLDESRGRLYVGEFGGEHRVLVFDGMHL